MNRIKVSVVQRPSIDPVQFIAATTKLTMVDKSFDELLKGSYTNQCKIVNNLISMGHGSPLEHINYSILIEGASRSFLAQVRTHRLASFTSASQHYIDYSNSSSTNPIDLFVVPVEIWSKQLELADEGECPLEFYLDANMQAFIDYKDLIEERGLDHSVARQVLPNAMRNNLLITANVRQWLKMIELRVCARNTSETFYVFNKIADVLAKENGTLFHYAGPECEKGKCNQGHLKCGKNPFTEYAHMTTILTDQRITEISNNFKL